MKSIISWLSLGSLLLVLLLSTCKQEAALPVDGSLPRSTPEAEGVSSQDILTFLDSIGQSRHEFHSIMILRHGKVIAEGWWAPYQSDLRHTLYSTSKSFTSTAVGFAVTEKLLTVNDKVISFFPDNLPDTVSPFLADMTVKDLLTMSAGQDPDPTFTVRSIDSNWVRSFLALPIVNDPGSKFLYNSMATYMLSAIVQKLTGEKLIDYLTPRLFEPLGIKGMDWETDPLGINTGGWGLRLKTEDMAKFGQLYLQKGSWNGKQIIPAAWVEEATTFKIDQAPDTPQAVKDSNDWMQGYCYQFWRCRHNAYRADGAFGQYIIVLPEKDAVIAITSESPDMGDQMNMIWNYLLPAFKDDELSGNNELSGILKDKLASLALPLPLTGNASPALEKISGKTYNLGANDQKIESVNFHFMEGMCHATFGIDGATYTLSFGDGKWMPGETSKPGPNLIPRKDGMPAEKVVGAYSWKDDMTLELVFRYIESPHTEVATCKFIKDEIQVNIHFSMPPGRDFPVIKGKLAE